jgi:signal transduction histidine kinase
MGSEEGKIFIAFGLVAFFLMMVISVFIYRLVRQHGLYRKLENEKKAAEFQARERELFEIATELHNEIGPLLASIRIRLFAIEGNDRQEIDACANDLSHCVHQIRTLSHKIAPLSVYKATFQQALEPYIERVRSEKGLQIIFHELSDVALSDEAHTHIYRILQEIISNTIKHAKASQLLIETSIDGTDLLIRTSDDGIGFNMREIRAQSVNSMGLASIESRLALMGGELKFPEETVAGCKFNFRIPLEMIRQ